MKIIRNRNRQAYVLGNRSEFGASEPRYAKVHGVYPRFTILFGDTREAVSKKLTYRNDSKQFSFSLPAQTLALPNEINAATASGTRIGPYEWAFDLTLVRTIQDQAFEHLLAFAKLARQWSDEQGTLLEDEIGVHVIWHEDDPGDEAGERPYRILTESDLLP